ncbi:Scopoletin glucosyltransferase [Linum perenne]
MCLIDCFKRYEPCRGIESDSEPFVLPGIPHRIELKKSQIPPHWRGGELDKKFIERRDLVEKSEENSYGAVVNSFVELELEYVEHYREVIGRKAWFIGPLSLSNKDNTLEKAERGDVASNSKEPNSVLYICFGSVSGILDAQLLEIAAALEASGQSFIWVVKKGASSHEEKEEWLPQGFEKRMEGKGLIIRGWAPQVLILDHKATRAMELKEKAVKANEEGGSSYSDLKSLLQELASVRDKKNAADLSTTFKL